MKKVMDIFKRAVNRRFVGFEKEKNSTWRGPFCFIQAADTQFGLIDELKHVDWNQSDISKAVQQSKIYKSKAISVWNEEMRLSEISINQWNSMNPEPRFVVICGDLANDYPGEPLREAQVEDFKKIFSKLKSSIPLILLPGNHDILNRSTPDSIDQYRANFGDDYFVFWVDGVMFIVINVQYYKDKSGALELAEEHDRWLDERLVEASKANYKHIIVFQHIPWFLHDINEPLDDIFNIAFEERIRMITKFNKCGVRAIFAGHYHRNAGGMFENMELVVTSAMGAQIASSQANNTTKSGYRIVQVEEDRISHRYVEIE